MHWVARPASRSRGSTPRRSAFAALAALVALAALMVVLSGAAVARAGDAAASLVGITNVRFEHTAVSDRVILETTGQAAAGKPLRADGKVFIELTGVRLPAALQRTLDVGAFGGPVRAISTYRRGSDPSRVVVELEGALESASAEVTREGTSIVISIAGGSAHSMTSGVGADGGAARRTRTVAREDEPANVPKVETSFGAAASVTELMSDSSQVNAFAPTMLAQQRRFTGRRIDLDLKDADIHNVVRLIADVGRVNIVTSDAVTGSVTIRMRNVPWDQALETVLQAKGLGMVRQGNMIRVAPLADLNKERELALARARSELALAPLETRLIPISYADAKDMMDRAKDMLSPRGTLTVDERTNVLIARDVAGNLNQIEELIRSLDTQTPQVLIEARVVEATSRYLRDVGIQWGGGVAISPATGNPTGLAFPSSIGVAGGATDSAAPLGGLAPFGTPANPNFAVNLPAVVGTGQGGAIGLTFGSINNTVNLAVRLSAAESSGMLRIISSPRILTLDNREARISQGTLIPFSQITAQGVQTTFQEAKLQLLVRPHVTADGSVAMHVKINRDEPDFNQTSARGDPTILKREAETDLLIMDGHTAVIGGIFTRNSGRNLDQVPVLGDIPVLGVLFQRRRASDTRSELVIFLTPRIVNRAEALGK
jgi:type IV pilus assembly protein PilQ